MLFEFIDLDAGLIVIRRVCVWVLLAMGAVSHAHAQQTIITFYGIVDLGLQWQKIDLGKLGADVAAGQRVGLASGAQSGSRWGFRGEEKLNADLSAVFDLENGFDATDGTTQGNRLFGRQSTLGLRSQKLGHLDFGRQSNLATKYFLAMDPFGQGYGQANMGASFGSANTVRYSNMVLFQTPSFNGFKLGAGYSFDTRTSQWYANNPGASANDKQSTDFPSMNNPRAITLGANYARGDWMLSAAYDQVMGNLSIPGGAPPSIPRAWLIGGLYDFKAIKLSAVYGQGSGGAFLGQPPGTSGVGWTSRFTVTGSSDMLFDKGFQNRSYLVGATVPIGGYGSVFGSWQMMQPTGSLNDELTASQQIFSLGYTYAFSARVNLYTYASYAKNYAMVRDTSSSMAGAGLRYRF